MDDFTGDGLAIGTMVFILGLRHGLDADHLATIDGLTRCNAALHPRTARWCGVLFSLGHGLVVMGLTVAISTLATGWVVPPWMEDVGALISIAFLFLLGALNLRAVLGADPGQPVPMVGIRARAFGRFNRIRHPLLILGIGGLFALSFDTLSQTTLFLVAAAHFGDPLYALLFGFTFMVGMMLADGINGLWVSHLLRRADLRAALASRIMGLTVASLSLSIGGFQIWRYLSPELRAVSAGQGLLLGGTVVVFVLGGTLIAWTAASPPR